MMQRLPYAVVSPQFYLALGYNQNIHIQHHPRSLPTLAQGPEALNLTEGGEVSTVCEGN